MAGERRSGQPRAAPKSSDPVCSALAVLIDDERGRAEHPLMEALLEARGGDCSPAVRQAAETLLRSSAPWCLEVTGLLSRLLDASGDRRSRQLFLERSLSRRDRPTATLAGCLKLSQRRTRELLDRSEVQVRAAFARAPAPLPWTVSALRRRLGAITTVERADTELASLGVKPGRCSDLALWLAGPYREIRGYPGWLGEEGTDLVARTIACLSADGGVRPLVDVVQEIGAGVRVEWLAEWLAASGAAVVSDVVVSVSGALVDVVERVLDAHGVALTLDELARCVAAGGRELPVGRLQAVTRSRRFRTVSGGRQALADWHDRDSAVSPNGPAGPRGRQPDAAEDLSATAATGAGMAGPTRPRPKRRQEPSPTVGDAGRQMLWVRIDAETLHGSEAFVPLSLVEGLGLAPGSRRTFSSRYGPITLAHDGPIAIRRSVRAVALAAGAHINDTLLLSFSARGDIDVGVRRHMGDSDSAEPSSTDTDIFLNSATSGAT